MELHITAGGRQLPSGQQGQQPAPKRGKKQRTAAADAGASGEFRLRAWLTPEGSRSFQLNGKNQSAGQIKVGMLVID